MTAVSNARRRYQESKFQLVYNYKACHDVIVERVVSHLLNMVVALTPAWEEIEPQLRTMAQTFTFPSLQEQHRLCKRMQSGAGF
jgi:ABC-type uncharacterized transport system YnjBCD permease subunit